MNSAMFQPSLLRARVLQLNAERTKCDNFINKELQTKPSVLVKNTQTFIFPSPYSNPVNHDAFLWGLLYRKPVCESPRLFAFLTEYPLRWGIVTVLFKFCGSCIKIEAKS